MRILALISGGKDSIFAMHVMDAAGIGWNFYDLGHFCNFLADN